MTVDHVARQAVERPDATAVVHDGRVVSYPEFHRDIREVMAALGALGLAPGYSVAVGTENLYLHWLLLLACEGLGIGAASFLRGEAPSCGALLASVNLVMAAPGTSTAGARRTHGLTPSWIDDVLSRPEPAESFPRKSPDDPVRIVRTSGTTGESKRFLVTRRMHDCLSGQWQWGLAPNRRSRYLQTLPLTVRATYDLGSACLRAGGTLVLESRMKVMDAIVTHSITHAILLPVQLKAGLDHLAPDFPKPPELDIVSFGAPVSDALRVRVMERLATSLCDLYGTVEVAAASAIWQLGADGFGTVWPRVRAEAVDEHGEPVPPGEIGRIRLKSDCMSVRYLGDPETTRCMFRDGWFYPGDAGVIAPDGRLKILGRTDDLLNIGGQKFLPAVLEELLMKRAIAGDVGVSSLPSADGIDELCIAVADVGHDDQGLMDRILDALRNVPIGRFHTVKLDCLPRSTNGKLQRKVLKEQVARALRPR